MFRIIRPVAALVLALLVVIFFVRPKIADLNALQAESNQYADVLSKATEFNRLIEQLYSQQNALSALERERLDTFVPPVIDEIRALVDLEKLANQHGMIFQDITAELQDEAVNDEPSRASRSRSAEDVDGELFGGRLESREVSFSVLGTYEQFRSFLRELERSLVLMEVTKIEFAGSEEGVELTNYDVTVRLYGIAPVSVE